MLKSGAIRRCFCCFVPHFSLGNITISAPFLAQAAPDPSRESRLVYVLLPAGGGPVNLMLVQRAVDESLKLADCFPQGCHRPEVAPLR